MIKTNYIYNAKIINVVDGDTVDATVDLGFTVFVKIRFRLAGLDTAEITSADPAKKELARKAKELAKVTLLDKDVVIESKKTDKYGRWLADVYVNDELFNQKLINEGLAVPYDGGKKA